MTAAPKHRHVTGGHIIWQMDTCLTLIFSHWVVLSKHQVVFSKHQVNAVLSFWAFRKHGDAFQSREPVFFAASDAMTENLPTARSLLIYTMDPPRGIGPGSHHASIYYSRPSLQHYRHIKSKQALMG